MTREEAIKDIRFKIAEAKAFKESYVDRIKVLVLEIALEALEKQTTEVREIKHAHWIPLQYPFGECECSNCQEEYGICGSLLGNYNYCPNCGAIMDEKENE